MTAIYFAKPWSDGKFGASTRDKNPHQNRISTEEIDQAFVECAKKLGEADLSKEEPGATSQFKAVVIRIDRESDAVGQFESTGYWLLKGVSTDQFIEKFRERFPNSITTAELERESKEAIAKMRKERGQGPD